MEKVPQVEEAFSRTSEILLGSALAGLDDYGEWLKRGVRWKREEKSELSGKGVWLAKLSIFERAKRGFVTLDESHELGKKPSPVKKVGTLSLQTAGKDLKGILFFAPEAIMGESVGVSDMFTYFSSQYSIRGIYSNQSKFTAYCYWPRNSEYVFGCTMVFSCKFCIKCYNSENLTRCFEVSDSFSCSDSYFCHNCENLNDCMLCFNEKNLRNAIGNVEYPREEYMRAKKMALSEVSRRLVEGKSLDANIFNLMGKR